MATIENFLKATDLITDVRRAFGKIESLEQSHKTLADTLVALDARVREVEAGLREARAEIKLDALRETQSIVNGVQGQLYRELTEVKLAVDRLSREPSPLALPPKTS